MATEKTELHKRIESGKQILVSEVSPPKSSDPAALRELVKGYAGKVHALGISDNRSGASMSALVAASLVLSESIEPILHICTRDRNRTALISDFLGAQALGIRNVLCTTGTHQTLGPSRMAKNVFDIDSIHLLAAYAGLSDDGSIVGEQGLDGGGPVCLGAAAAPYADPLEMQVIRLVKKVSAGARFLITQPVFDFERFGVWWNEVTGCGLHEKVAILAGIKPLTDAEEAKSYASQRPLPMVSEKMLDRLASKTSQEDQRATGIEMAIETIEQLSTMKGLRGFEIYGDTITVLDIIEKTGLGRD